MDYWRFIAKCSSYVGQVKCTPCSKIGSNSISTVGRVGEGQRPSITYSIFGRFGFAFNTSVRWRIRPNSRGWLFAVLMFSTISILFSLLTLVSFPHDSVIWVAARQRLSVPPHCVTLRSCPLHQIGHHRDAKYLDATRLATIPSGTVDMPLHGSEDTESLYSQCLKRGPCAHIDPMLYFDAFLAANGIGLAYQSCRKLHSCRKRDHREYSASQRMFGEVDCGR